MAATKTQSQINRVSTTRLYVGRIPEGCTEEKLREHFAPGNPSGIKEVKILPKYAFVEFNNLDDAAEAVPHFHGKPFGTENSLVVQFARLTDNEGAPRDQRQPGIKTTPYGIVVSGLPAGTSWQDLKDHARLADVTVKYSHAPHKGEGTGAIYFDNDRDLTLALIRLNDSYFRDTDHVLQCVVKVNRDRSLSPRPRGSDRSRTRSRSPRPEYRRRDDYGPSSRGSGDHARHERGISGGYGDRDRDSRFRYDRSLRYSRDGGRYDDRGPRRDDGYRRESGHARRPSGNFQSNRSGTGTLRYATDRS